MLRAKENRKSKVTYRDYSPSKVVPAVQAIKGGLSARKAALLYGVPKSTLLDRIHGRYPTINISIFSFVDLHVLMFRPGI